MAKDIQIKYINESREWEELFPATKTRLITDDSGTVLSTLLGNKAEKNQTYTSTEVDNLLNDVRDDIGNIETIDLPVSETEPDDANIWFEIL